MHQCTDHCSGNCGGCNGGASCGGCTNQLTLSQPELEILQTLGQFAFLPVARKADDMTPIYPDSESDRETVSLALQLLEKKALIDIDYSKPLVGVDMGSCTGYPVHGSIALTARGQQILELVEIQGCYEE